jgi:hypothetical protein
VSISPNDFARASSNAREKFVKDAKQVVCTPLISLNSPFVSMKGMRWPNSARQLRLGVELKWFAVSNASQKKNFGTKELGGNVLDIDANTMETVWWPERARRNTGQYDIKRSGDFEAQDRDYRRILAR